MKHPCHALGCEVEVEPRLLACPRHWRLVPRPVQKLVWRTYEPGQEVRKDPSAAYLAAQALALAWIAYREGRDAAEVALFRAHSRTWAEQAGEETVRDVDQAHRDAARSVLPRDRR